MALTYSRSVLQQLSSFSSALLCPLLWRRLTEHGITRIKSTRWGCRGGRRKRGNSVSCLGTARQFRANVSPTLNEDDSIGSDQTTTQDHESSNLHNRSSCLLNIQGNTFQASKTNNLSVPPVSPENGTNTSRLSSGNCRTDDNWWFSADVTHLCKLGTRHVGAHVRAHILCKCKPFLFRTKRSRAINLTFNG